MNKFTGKHLMLVIAMCGVIGTSIGLPSNTAGVFFTPIAEEFGIGKGSVSMTTTICSLVMAFSGMISGKVIQPTNFRRSMILWMGIIAASTAGLAACPNIYMMYVLQAIRGFAAGLVGMVMVTPIINSWFYKNVGLFTSICIGFSGLTGAVLSPVLTSIIQTSGWRMAYIVSAVIAVIFALPSILFPIGMTPESACSHPYGTKSAGAQSEDDKPRSYTSFLFLLLAAYACLACYGTAFPQHFPGIAESFGMSASIGALMVSIAMVCNTGGKILLGILVDALGCRKSNSLFLIIVGIGALLLALLHSSITMFAGAAMIGLSYSLGSVGIVMATKDIFGSSNYNKVYPKVALCTTLINSVMTSIIGFLYDSTNSYTLALLSLTIFAAGAVVLLYACYKRKIHEDLGD